MSAEDSAAGGRFPATHWSLVARAGQSDPLSRQEALGQLLKRYIPALRAHLVYRKGFAPDRADDFIQEFVAGKVLQKDLIARADRRLGKFRTFLLTALDRFVNNQLRNESAKKRAPEKGTVPLDERFADASPHRGPGEAFDVAWARSVISEALRQMREHCEASGRPELWALFECRVVGPILEGTPPVDYARLVERFGFRSPIQASNALTTAKRMYARELRAVVGQYADSDEEVEAEIRELKCILAYAGAGSG
jgi:DNA-directed RNA polymerase specialized sigma24 family protein